MIEHIFALKLMVVMTIVLFFTVLICSFAVVVETESFEAMICALEGRSTNLCLLEFVKKVEALPELKVKEPKLTERNETVYFEARIVLASFYQIHFIRNETLRLK